MVEAKVPGILEDRSELRVFSLETINCIFFCEAGLLFVMEECDSQMDMMTFS